MTTHPLSTPSYLQERYPNKSLTPPLVSNPLRDLFVFYCRCFYQNGVQKYYCFPQIQMLSIKKYINSNQTLANQSFTCGKKITAIATIRHHNSEIDIPLPSQTHKSCANRPEQMPKSASTKSTSAGENS